MIKFMTIMLANINIIRILDKIIALHSIEQATRYKSKQLTVSKRL